MIIILTPIDKHLSFAQSLLHPRNHEIRVLAFQPFCQRPRELLRPIIGSRCIERDEDLQAF
jgi:hypothetical protein